MTDRAGFLRRAGIGAAGLSLADLLGAAPALAGDGGGDFPPHPTWRFVFVSDQTLDPLLVAAQFGAQDAAALVKCSIEWTGSPSGSVSETVGALQTAISGHADGIAVSIVDRRAFDAAMAAAAKAHIPLLAFNADFLRERDRIAYTGEDPAVSGARASAEIKRLSRREPVALIAPQSPEGLIERRLRGILADLARAPKGPPATVVRLGGNVYQQETAIASMLKTRPHIRGLYGVESVGSAAAGNVIKSKHLRSQGFRGGGYDLLPGDLSLVSDGYLDFVVDPQPYAQGFAAALQLFVAKISQGTVSPWNAETSIVRHKADVQTLLATRSRFDGSSSRHEYPLARA